MNSMDLSSDTGSFDVERIAFDSSITELRERLLRLFSDYLPKHVVMVGTLMDSRLEIVVDQFYTEILEIEQTHAVLSHGLVHKNLKNHLRHWIQSVYLIQSPQDIDTFIARQQRVGKVHANINVPIDQFMYAYSILRRIFFQQLLNHIDQPDLFGELFLILGEIFDLLAALIGHAYINFEVAHENNEFLMKFKGFQKGAAIDCERLRSSLLDWLRTTLNLLYQSSELNLHTLPTLGQSNFGLWVVYKGDLFSPSLRLQEELQEQVAQIDAAFLGAAQYKVNGEQEAFLNAIISLNDAVSKTSWYLANLVDELIEIDIGLDPLTRLFNRRYLSTILRRQIEIGRKMNFPYAVLLFDLDHFKQVNDQYGHLAGDEVLKQFAELLLVNTRSADFAFRYGGEEFLLVLGNASYPTALTIAERIRRGCEGLRLAVGSKKLSQITCSVGVAVIDGHPDPERILRRADYALYQAKGQGRNRVVLASDDMVIE